MTQTAKGPRLTVFASDKGVGDAERASIMTQAGNLIARRGAKLLCVAERGQLPVPLITAARAAGGPVSVIADAGISLPPALSAVPIEVIPEPAERHARIGAETDVFVGLPGSLASLASLFAAWTSARQAGRKQPLVLVNRNRAYEALRGYAADVLSHGLKDYDHVVQFADSAEDMWVKVTRMLEEIGWHPPAV